MSHAGPMTSILAVFLLLSGCIGSGGSVSRERLDFPVVSSVNGISDANGTLRLAGTDGLAVSSDAPNGTIVLGLSAPLRTQGGIEACDVDCGKKALTNGTILADTRLMSGGNVSLNAFGPDRDSAIDFFEAGSRESLTWRHGEQQFQLSRGLDVLGNVTARHHVGTVTTILVGGPRPSSVEVATAALEGNEATVFLRGSATLTNGAATVAFPIEFRVLVGQGPITAQVTPTSAGGPIYVSQKSGDSIQVRAFASTSEPQTFDYFVQATRAASEDFVSVPPG